MRIRSSASCSTPRIRTTRAAAFASVTADSPGPGDAVVGATIDVPGAEEAWRCCFDETSNAVACGVDLRVGELWMQVRTESEEALPPAVERIVANLTA